MLSSLWVLVCSQRSGVFSFLSPSSLLKMSDANVGVSAYFPHSVQPNEVMQAFRKLERQSGAWGAGVSPPPGCVPDVASGETMRDTVVSADATGPCDCGTTCGGLDWESSSGDDGTNNASKSSGQRQPTPLGHEQPPPPPLDQRVPTTPPVSPTAVQLGFALSIARCGSAMTPSLAGGHWVDALRVQLSSPASRQ